MIYLIILAAIIAALWFFLPASRPTLKWVGAGLLGFIVAGWEWLSKALGV